MAVLSDLTKRLETSYRSNHYLGIRMVENRLFVLAWKKAGMPKHFSNSLKCYKKIKPIFRGIF